MPKIAVNNQELSLNRDGRLKYLSDWTPEVAAELAVREGLKLTQDHWDVINVMRDYYKEFNIPPLLKLLRRTLAERFGPSRASNDYLEGLFPKGVMMQSTRMAGLPMPHLDAELDELVEQRVTAVKPEQVTPAAKPVTHFVNHFEFNGETFHVSKSGNLLEHHRWSEDMARFMANKEGIELTQQHWVVLNFMRQFYFEYGITPMVRLLMKHMRQTLGTEYGSEEYIYKLFPGGPSRQGSRIAGLPMPQGCID